MKSKALFIIYSILLITSFFSKIKGKNSTKFSKMVLKEKGDDENLVKSKERNSIRKLQNSNYVSITFGDLAEDLTTNSCWYTQIQDSISRVEVNEEEVNYANGFQITSGDSIKIYFSNQLTDLSYFLTYNPDNIPTGCEGYTDFTSNIQAVDLSNLDTSQATTATNMFFHYTSLTTVDFFNTDTSRIESMQSMFNGCTSLIEIDLTSLLTDSVTDMSNMFYECTSLEFVDFSFTNTASLINMDSMFCKCQNLISVYLTDFDTSNVVSMESVFKECQNLVSLDLSSWDITKVTSILNIFSGCNSLIALEIPNFFMEKLLSDKAFENTELNKLRYMNIKNMKYSSDTSPDDVVLCEDNGCPLPINFNDKPVIVCQTNKFITNSNIYEICCTFNYDFDMCISDNFIVLNFNHECSYTNGFKNNYRNDINFINYNGETLPDSSALNIAKDTELEIHFKTLATNMEKFFSWEGDNNMMYVTSIDFTHFISSSITNMGSLFLGCSSLKTINFENFETSEVTNMASMLEYCLLLNSIDLSNFDTRKVENMNSMFYDCDSLKILNLSYFETPSLKYMDRIFYGCSSLKILDISNFNFLSVINATQIFSIHSISNLEYINLYNIKDTNIISTSLLNTDDTIENIFYICQKTNIITNIKSLNCCNFIDNETYCRDQIIPTVLNSIITTIMEENKLIDEIYRSTIVNMKDDNSKLIHLNNNIFQFGTIEEQLKNVSNGISSVDLGECEQKIKEQEGLNETEEFLMIKLDILNSNFNSTYVQYEIFNPHNYTKVSLDICKNTTIKIKVPVILEDSKLSMIADLEENGYNAFDINDSFYNNICSTYSAPNGADMVLSLRKNLIYDSIKEIYLCQEGCEFKSFDSKSSSSECHCKIQLTEMFFGESKVSFSKTEFADSFYKTLYYSNYRVLKCIKLIFSFDGFKENYGCYIMTLLLAVFITFIIVHIIKGNSKIIKIMKQIIKSKGVEIKSHNNKTKENDKENNKDNNKENTKENNKDIEDNKGRIIRRPNYRRQKTQRYSRQNLHKKKLENLQAPHKRHTHKKRTMQPQKMKIGISDMVYNTNDEMNKATIENVENNPEINNQEEKQILDKYKDLIDEEKNRLDYEIAVIVDKRTFCQYYISLLKRGHLIIFTFITMDDFNLRQLKILLFIVSFALYFCINAFFFTDETMNNIYDDNGIFNFLFQLPQIFYSSIISAVINMILEKLIKTEEQILDMKKEEEREKVKHIAKNIKKCLKIKLRIFFVLTSALMIFFWYFISCFCAVYKNTQLILIEDTLISFFTSMIYPFGLKLLPGMFRIPSLRAIKRDQKCIYRISRILSYL